MLTKKETISAIKSMADDIEDMLIYLSDEAMTEEPWSTMDYDNWENMHTCLRLIYKYINENKRSPKAKRNK